MGAIFFSSNDKANPRRTQRFRGILNHREKIYNYIVCIPQKALKESVTCLEKSSYRFNNILAYLAHLDALGTVRN